MGKLVSIAYESKSDIAALREDGYKDGLVNSDSAFDGAIDDMRGKPNPQALIEPNVDIAVKSYRDDLVEAIAGPRSKMQDLEEAIAYDGNKRRSGAEQKKHLEAYLDGYRSGFRVRLQNAVRDGDAVWGAGERQSAHPFFISYWGRSGKQEALIWAKDEQSALGLLRSAIPSADVRSVEQREAEPGVRRGRNVYAMGSEAGEAAEAGEPRSRRPLEDVYQEDRAQAERAATQALSALGIQYARLSEQQRMMSGTFVFQATGSENTPAPPGYPGLARMPFHVEVYKKTTTVARGMASMQTFPYGYRGIGAREDSASEGVLSWRRTPAGGAQSQGRHGAWTITPSDAQFRLYYGSDPNQPSSLVGTFASIAAAKSDAEWREERMSMQPRGEPVPLEGGWPVGETKASEGPHAQPFNVAPSVHACTKDTALAIAQQIPGGPWAYIKSYPKEAQARVDRQQDVEVTTPQGRQRVTAYYCGRHLMLRCPTGTQFLFESSCIGDVPSGKAPAAPQGVQAKPGKPFIVRLKRGKELLAELGPFATPTEAFDMIGKNKHPEKGDLAGIYKDGKVIDFRGGKAAYAFGRTRWSRA